MYPSIQAYCQALSACFGEISPARRTLLERLAAYISDKRQAGQPVDLVYVCTHNSRRSIFGQVWAKVASAYYQVPQVNTFSGGTEATAFHPNAIAALQRAGCVVKAMEATPNARYQVYYAETDAPLLCFSKVYDHSANPQTNFAAIMTCGEAEANCPFLPGVELRIATTYEDPKAFDNTALQDAKYDERCRQIALEALYTFSLVAAAESRTT